MNSPLQKSYGSCSIRFVSNNFLLKKESKSIKEQEVRSRTLTIAALILTLSSSALCSPQTDSATESEIHLDISAF